MPTVRSLRGGAPQSVAILHVIADLKTGGAQRIVYALAEMAHGTGNSVTVLGEPGIWSARLRSLGVEVVDLPPSRRSVVATARAARFIRKTVRSISPTIIHTHNVRVTAATSLAMLPSARRTPVVTTVHGLAAPDYRLAARVLPFAAGVVVACSQHVASSLLTAGFPPSKLTVIQNGVAELGAKRPRRRIEEPWACQGRWPVVVGVGRLVKEKNWPLFLDVATRIPAARFVIVGAGPLLDDLLRRAPANVELIGAVDDVRPVLQSADVYLSTSSSEGLPLSLLEALSAGLPVVCTAVGGVGEVVDERSAILAPSGAVDALTAGVALVLSNSAVREALTSGGQAAIAELPSMEQMAAEYLRLYATLLNRGS